MLKAFLSFSFLALFLTGLYDVFTSFYGTYALLSLTADAPLLLWGFPVVVSFGAFALNSLTLDIWSDINVPIMRVIWILFIAWDIYTSFLGVTIIITGYPLFAVNSWDISTALQVLSGERLFASAGLTLLVVASPMGAYYVAKRIKEV